MRGFLGAWLGALGAAIATTVTGDYLRDAEHGASFLAFVITAAMIIEGVALAAGSLGAAFIRQARPGVASRPMPLGRGVGGAHPPCLRGRL